MVIFDRKIDWIIIALPVALAVFFFYGFPAGLISALIFVALFYMQPIRARVQGEWQRALLAAGVVLIFSGLWRYLFTEQYCVNAASLIATPVVNPDRGGVATMFEALVAGCYLNIPDWRGDFGLRKSVLDYIRDFGVPLLGLIGLFTSLSGRKRVAE